MEISVGLSAAIGGIEICIGSFSILEGISSGTVARLAATSCSAISLQKQAVYWLHSPQPIVENEPSAPIGSSTGC